MGASRGEDGAQAVVRGGGEMAGDFDRPLMYTLLLAVLKTSK